MLDEAAATAFQQKDVSGLKFVLAQCESSDKQLIDKVNKYLFSLKNLPS